MLNEEFEKHPIHITLKKIHTTLKETADLIEAKFTVTSSGERPEMIRFLKLRNDFGEALKNFDRDLISYSTLDQINTAIRHQDILGKLAKYHSNENHRHLINANNLLTNVSVQISQILAATKRSKVNKPIKELEDEIEKTSSKEDAFVAFEKNAMQKLEKKLRVGHYKLYTPEKSYIVAILAFIDVHNLDLELPDIIKLSGDEFAQHFEIFKSKVLSKVVDFCLRKNRIENGSIGTWEKKFEQDAKTQIEEIIKNSTEKLTSEYKIFDKKISIFIKNAEEKHAEILDTHKKILELHEIVAGDSVAAGYLQNAKNEKWDANFWRWATVLFIVSTAAWTVSSYFVGNTISASGDIQWEQIIKAFPVTGVLLFGAAYSAKQSNSHRQNEKQTRWFALAIKAIDPFIASLSEDDQKAIKNKFSERLFDQQHNSTDRETTIMYEHIFATIVKVFKNILKAK